jgi:SAM-dependent methyltransferase
MMTDYWDEQAVDEQGAWHAVFSEPGVEEHTAVDVDIITSLLGDRLPLLPLVEVGCGVGRLTGKVQTVVGREVVGFDTSTRMLSWALARRSNPYIDFVHGGPDVLLTHDRVFTGGWSMLCFQHMAPAMVYAWLLALSERMVVGSPFVVQFVTADDDISHSHVDHRYRPATIAGYASAVGFAVWDQQVDQRHPEWMWMTLRREE